MYKNIEFYQAQKDIEELKNRPIPESCDCSSINYVKTVEELTTVLTDPDTPRFIDVYLLPHTRFVLTETIISNKFVRLYGNGAIIDGTNVRYGLWLGVILMQDVIFYDGYAVNEERFLVHNGPYPNSDTWPQISFMHINLGNNGLIKNCKFMNAEDKYGGITTANRYTIVIWSGIYAQIESCEFINSNIWLDGLYTQINNSKLDKSVVRLGSGHRLTYNNMYLCTIFLNSENVISGNELNQTRLVNPIYLNPYGSPDRPWEFPLQTNYCSNLIISENTLYMSMISLCSLALSDNIVIKNNHLIGTSNMVAIQAEHGEPYGKFTTINYPINYRHNHLYDRTGGVVTLEILNNGHLLRVGINCYIDKLKMDEGQLGFDFFAYSPVIPDGSTYTTCVEVYKNFPSAYHFNKPMCNGDGKVLCFSYFGFIRLDEVKAFRNKFYADAFEEGGYYIMYVYTPIDGSVDLNVDSTTGIITSQHKRIKYKFSKSLVYKMHTVAPMETTNHLENTNEIKYLAKNEDGSAKYPTADGLCDSTYGINLESEIIPLTGCKYLELNNVRAFGSMIALNVKYLKATNCILKHADGYSDNADSKRSCIDLLTYCKIAEIENCYFEKLYSKYNSKNTKFEAFVTKSYNSDESTRIILKNNKYYIPNFPEFEKFTNPLYNATGTVIEENTYAMEENYIIDSIKEED